MMQVREGGGISKECRVPVWNEGKAGLETACCSGPCTLGWGEWALYESHRWLLSKGVIGLKQCFRNCSSGGLWCSWLDV